tara:strand:+ start:882 stop:1703 length:822 start_codon:yes stop_codon:yes gene_type:complete
MKGLFPDSDVIHLTEDMPQEPKDHPDFWRIWRETVVRCEPRKIDFVFASESYGERLAEELGARFVPFDLDREMMPISGTDIRENPIKHWDMLPGCTHGYFAKRVCMFGPESTGKSTLTRILAEKFKTVYAWEHARALLDPNGGACEESDIPLIARAQLSLEAAMLGSVNRVLFCDTNLLMTVIWSEVLFGSCPDWIRAAAAHQHYDLTLLLDVDVPWVDDDQRYFPGQDARVQFFERCRAALEEKGDRYEIIRGDYPERLKLATAHVERLLTE